MPLSEPNHVGWGCRAIGWLCGVDRAALSEATTPWSSGAGTKEA
jgi:hypothetical protein